MYSQASKKQTLKAATSLSCTAGKYPVIYHARHSNCMHSYIYFLFSYRVLSLLAAAFRSNCT